MMRLRRHAAATAMLVLIAMGFSGCTSTQRGAAIGAAIGAGAGAAAGHHSRYGSGRGALVGAAVGGLAGALAADAIEEKRKRDEAATGQVQQPAAEEIPEPVYVPPTEGYTPPPATNLGPDAKEPAPVATPEATQPNQDQ